MDFRISDTFTDSLSKLTDQEQKSVKTTAFDLQLNPSNPGLQFHKIGRAKDPNFWSIRVNRDIRLIIHRTNTSLLLCYVDHHDKAYKWAERRKLETHPKTGAAQLVEIRETVKEFTIPKYVAVESSTPIFADIPDDDLLRYGVPVEWLNDVRKADEDTILDLADYLPKEAAEALLELATGGTPEFNFIVADGTDPFDHPDAQRRFRVMEDVEELERALLYPWEKWTIFLHPYQRQVVEYNFNGPARISGSAGTGKTVVALHRAVSLASKNPDVRVLLTTFSEVLSNALKTKLIRLIGNKPRLGECLEVYSMNGIGQRLYELNFGRPKLATNDTINMLLKEAAENIPRHKISHHFLISEWEQVVDAWQLKTWEEYRDVLRLGRKTRLLEKQRTVLWSIFKYVRDQLNSQDMITLSDLFSRLATMYIKTDHLPFDHIIVDESQDISVAQLRFLAAIGSRKSNSLFFAGDLGQRIFQQPFSWKALGVDIRGRSRTLRINYRTSHQIRTHADRLLGPELSDVDGNTEKRRGTISLFNGPAPTIIVFENQEKEIAHVSQWLSNRIKEGIKHNEIGVFVRAKAELIRAQTAIERIGQPQKVLAGNSSTNSGYISIGTMHLAKGLEFRAVAVMACDDEIIPLQNRIEMVSDDTDLEEVYNTERHLLYVACTRARDHLLVTGSDPASEFLDDLFCEKMKIT